MLVWLKLATKMNQLQDSNFLKNFYANGKSVYHLWKLFDVIYVYLFDKRS